MNYHSLFSGLFFVCLSFHIHSQTITPGNSTITPGGGRDKTQAIPTDRTVITPPENVKTQFETDHPGKSAVTWKVEGNNFRVNYTDPKTNMEHSIVYDKDGKIVRRENEIDRLTYPSAISDYYQEKYPNEKYRVWQTEREEGKVYYFINRKGKTLWFNQEGKNITDIK